MRSFAHIFAFICVLFSTLGAWAQMPYPIDTIHGQAVYHYPVQKGEGLYRISVNFGVSQEELVQWNPILQHEGLKLGQTILVPVRHAAAAPATPAASATQEKPAVVAPAAVTEIPTAPLYEEERAFGGDEDEFFEQSPMQADVLPIRLAFLLPFCADRIDREANMDKFLVFYEGALLAIYDAQAAGQYMEIYVFDTGKGDMKVQQLLSNNALHTMDMIIGPAYPSQVSILSPFVKEKHIPCLVPFTNKVPDVYTNPYLWQFNPTVETGKRAIIFRSEENNRWAAFQARFTQYFHVNLFENQAYRYDLLGYDLTSYAIRCLQQMHQPEADEQYVIETPYNGLQSTLHFLKQGVNGGYMNQPMEVVDK